MGTAAKTVVALFVGACIGPAAWAEEAASSSDWPCWRGPKKDGPGDSRHQAGLAGRAQSAVARQRPLQGQERLLLVLPGRPGRRLVVPGREDDRDTVRCLDAATGQSLWKADYAAPGEVQYGCSARATPAIEEKRVYTFGCLGHLACWDLESGAICGRRPSTPWAGSGPSGAMPAARCSTRTR